MGALLAARSDRQPRTPDVQGQVTLDVSPGLLRRQVTLVGSWTFSKQGQAECAEFVADQKFGG